MFFLEQSYKLTIELVAGLTVLKDQLELLTSSFLSLFLLVILFLRFSQRFTFCLSFLPKKTLIYGNKSCHFFSYSWTFFKFCSKKLYTGLKRACCGSCCLTCLATALKPSWSENLFSLLVSLHSTYFVQPFSVMLKVLLLGYFPNL